MSFEIISTDPFDRKIKKLAKKYKSIKQDLQDLLDQLIENPTTGASLGFDCYKIRMAIASKAKGKSAGARVITYVVIDSKTIFLIDIYDKSEIDSISSKELKALIKALRAE
jgi:mRNA-degrading endonuclease RelE of RelBE toxin-antitoxin system